MKERAREELNKVQKKESDRKMNGGRESGEKKSFQNLLNHRLHVSVPSDRSTVVFILNEF